MALATGSVLLNLPEAQELVAKGGRLLQEGLVRAGCPREEKHRVWLFLPWH